MTYTVHSVEETWAVAAKVARMLTPGTVVALHGGLGAGKTTFAQGLGFALGVCRPVTSPTFTVCAEYQARDFLFVHMDLYRLSGPDDLLTIGFPEYLETGAVVAVEWPERAGDLIPPDVLHVTFSPTDHPEMRKIEIRRTQHAKAPPKKSTLLDMIEKTGNALPHPATIFLILSGVVAILSAILSALGVSVTFEGINRATNEIEAMTVTAHSLLSREGIQYMFTSAVGNFTGFAPLGTVLVALLGVGVSEGSGFIGALIKKIVLSAPATLITAIVVFTGISSNIASDAGYVVVIPLGAIVFMSFGRHPIAGLAAAFAGVSGGFSANLLLCPTDSLLGGLTTEAAHMINPNANVAMTANWYFLFASTFVLTFLGAWVTEKIVEPRLGKYKGTATIDGDAMTVSMAEKRGLRFAGLASILTVFMFALLVGPRGAALRGETPGFQGILSSPFMNSLVFIIGIFFAVTGIAYGLGAKTVRNDKDVMGLMGKSMSSMGCYLVLVFFAAQFNAYFSYSNMGTLLAVSGASGLERLGLTGIPLIVLFVLFTAFINLFMGSASAKWAILAPIFVPMFMTLGYAPEFVQLAYRIGDSSTNTISPLMHYFALIVTFVQKYDGEAGIGTLVSTMVPYAIVFLIGWTLLLVAWMFLGLPIGPGAGML